MRNQVGMDTGELTEGVWAPRGSFLLMPIAQENKILIRTGVLPVLDYA